MFGHLVTRYKVISLIYYVLINLNKDSACYRHFIFNCLVIKDKIVT